MKHPTKLGTAFWGLGVLLFAFYPVNLYAQFYGFTDPADGEVIKGVLTRINPPAFTLEVPAKMNQGEPKGTAIWTGSQSSSPFNLSVDIYDLGKGLEPLSKGIINGFKQYTQGIGSKKFEVIRSAEIDAYDEFKARVIEIEWMWSDGATMLTSVIHLIAKGDKVVGLSATLIGDPEQATAIFDTIDMDP